MQPFEQGDKVGRLRVVERVKHTHYRCSCTRCKGTVTVAAKALRLKREDVNCRLCYPCRPQPRLEVIRDRWGWLSVEAA